MSLTAAAIRKMVEMGLDAAQIADLCETIEEGFAKPVPALTAAALRQRRYRQKRNGDVTRDVTRDVTDDVTPSPIKENPPHPLKKITPLPSDPDGSSATPGRARPVRRCPDGWVPSPDDLKTGITEGFTPGEIERELAKFRDHTFATARSDWSATFRNWIRRAAEKNRPHERSHAKPKHSDRPDRLGRMLAGAMAAVDG